MIASYAFFFSMTLKTLLVDGKNTVLCQTNISQALYQKLQLTKMNFENCYAKNFPKTTVVIRFNLQVLSIHASSCTRCANYTLLSSLEQLFLRFIHFGDGSYCLGFDKFRDTAPLTQSIIFA